MDECRAASIELCVPDRSTYEAARGFFAERREDHRGRIEVAHKSIVAARHTALVSAGNSFAEMNGGVDGIINTHLSSCSAAYVQDAVKAVIRAQFAGELPVGQCVVVRTQHPAHTHLAYAPTMRVAEDVSASLNAYLAFRGALLELRRAGIASASAPLFCTGAGGMAPLTSCFQMLEAWQTLDGGTLLDGDWTTFHRHHRTLVAGA